MLIDEIPVNMWPGQRMVRPDDYPVEQQSLRADVSAFLRGHFRITGDRLFVIPPDKGINISGAMFQMGGPGQFAEIHSEPALDQRPYVVSTPDARSGGRDEGKTLLTVGVTQTGTKIYTAIALHTVPDSADELIGYFQLEPLIPDPAKGL